MAGPIKISIIADAGRAVAEFGRTETAVSRLGSRVSSASKFLGKAAFAGALVGVAALGAGIKSGVTDAISYEAAQKKATAALKVNGDQAGQTLGSLKSRAASIETLTGATQDENDVLDAQSRLLRTGIKGNKAFGDATLASANLAAAGNTGISQSAKVLAKALQDPTKAAGALRRAGVSLTAQQQKQIEKFVESGDTAKAQAIVLGAVNTQLAGQAKAAGQGTGAAFATIKDVLQDTARDLATQLLPALAGVANFLSANLPAAIAFATTAFNKIVAVVQALLPSFDTVKAAFGTFVAVLQNPAFQAFAAGIAAIVVALQLYALYQSAVVAVTSAWAAAQAALNVVLAANPIGLIVLAIIGLVAAFVVAYKQSETFRDIVNGVFSAVASFASAYFAVVGAVISAVFAMVSAVVTAFQVAAVAVWTAISASASAVWAAIGAAISAVVAAVSATVTAFKLAAVAVWNAISASASAVWGAIKVVINGVIVAVTAYINAYKLVVVTVFDAVKTAGTAAFNAIKTAVTSAIDGATALVRGFQTAANAVWSAVKAAAQAAFSAVRTTVSDAVSAVKTTVSTISGFFTDAFNKVKTAVSEGMDAAKQKVSDVVGSIKGVITGLDLYGAGKELMARLAAGVAAGAQAVIDKVSGMLSKVKGLLPGSPIRSGPLLEWNNVGAGGPGGQLMTRLAEGVRSQASEVFNAVSSVAAGISTGAVDVDLSASMSGLTTAPAAGGAVGTHTVVLPPPSQITNAEAGRVLYEQLLAFQKAYGPLNLAVSS